MAVANLWGALAICPEDFVDPAIDRLVEAEGGVLSFVPAKLPPARALEAAESFICIAEIHRMLKHISLLGRILATRFGASALAMKSQLPRR
ncbi:MAG: hypothetical protein WCD38_01370 [Candidatus Tumulicola sp.]